MVLVPETTAQAWRPARWRWHIIAGLLALLAPTVVAVVPYDDSGLAPAGLEALCQMPNLPVFNVKTYGAVGNGTTDDTVAIRNALAAAVAANGGIVFFPQGTYAVCRQAGDPVNFGMPAIFTITSSNLVFLGEGSAKSRLSGFMPGLQNPVTHWNNSANPNDYFKISRFSMFALNPTAAPVTNVQFRSLEITGNAGYTGDASVGGNQTTGDGWDMSHKCIALVGGQPSDAFIFNCSLNRWRGEIVYGGGNQGKVSILNTHIFSTNASALSISGDVLVNHAVVGGPNAGDDVYNGLENFCLGTPQKTVIQDCQIRCGSAANRHGNGVAYLGLPTSSLLIERSQITYNSCGILFSEFAYHVIVRNSGFGNNAQASLTSVLGMYPQYSQYVGFGDFLLENNAFDHSGAVILNQFYGNGMVFSNLVLRGNTVTNGALLGGAYNGPLNQPYPGFVVDGNTLGAGAVDTDDYVHTSSDGLANFALWTNTSRANVLATANGKYWLNLANGVTTAVITPATNITVVNEHDRNLATVSVSVSPAALPGYPTGFTTTILPGTPGRGWTVKVDAAWNTFTSDQTVGSSGLTIRKNAQGKFDLVSGTPVNVPPTVSLTAPANHATFTAPASVTISANAADSDGTITKVEFYQGGTKLGEDATSPYGITWSGVAADSYTLTAKAYDNSGAVTISAAVSITVANPSPVNVAPSIVAPAWANPNPVMLPNPASVGVTVSDDGLPNPPAALTYSWSKMSGPGTVMFSPNGTAANATSTATFSAAGTYVLRVTVSDGNLSVTSDVTVTVLAATVSLPPPAASGPERRKCGGGTGVAALLTGMLMLSLGRLRFRRSL
jgi:hypothetical protein